MTQPPIESFPMAYGFAPRAPRFHLGVLLLGFCTAVLALLADYLLGAFAHVEVMGIHLFYIIPAGAIGLGILAGIGFGIGSYFLNFKIREWFLWLMVLVLIVVYFLAQYVEFRAHGILLDQAGERLGFWRDFALVTEHMRWNNNDRPGEDLGGAGYAIRLAEVLGFSLGGGFSCIALMYAPYCELCGKYRRRWTVVTLPAGVSSDELLHSGRDTARQHEERLRDALSIADGFREMAAGGDALAFATLAREHREHAKAAAKLPRRVLVYFDRCPRCRAGELHAAIHTGSGKPIVNLVFKTELPREFIGGVEQAVGGG